MFWVWAETVGWLGWLEAMLDLLSVGACVVLWNEMGWLPSSRWDWLVSIG